MKPLLVLLAALLLSQSAWADNKVIWLVAKDATQVLLPTWKIEAVERSEGKLTVRTSTLVVTVVPSSDASELQGLDGSLVFYKALDRLLGHESTLTNEAYAAANKALQDKELDSGARQKNAALVIAFNSVFPCASISVRDVGAD